MHMKKKHDQTAGDFLYFVNHSNVQSQTNDELIYLQVLCVYPKPDVFLCAGDLYCPQTLKNTSVSHTAVMGDVFLRPKGNGYHSLFRNEIAVRSVWNTMSDGKGSF